MTPASAPLSYAQERLWFLDQLEPVLIDALAEPRDLDALDVLALLLQHRHDVDRGAGPRRPDPARLGEILAPAGRAHQRVAESQHRNGLVTKSDALLARNTAMPA